MSPLVFSLVLVCAVFADTADAEIVKLLCDLDGGYDISTLRKPPYWEVTISNTSQCPGFVKDKDHKCAVYFSFCQTLPKNSTLPAGSCSNPPSSVDAASVCMVIDNQTNDPQIMGQYNKTVDPFYKLKATDGRTAFAAEFPHGKDFNGNCTETITIVEFRCYSEADWDTAVGNNVTQFVISAGFPPDEDCLFLMVMQYKGACVTIPTPPFRLAIGVGWILIIIAICLVLLYIIVGTVVNAVRGKRKFKDLFPNYRFWKGFPQLLLDGLHFSLDLVTCHLCRNRPVAPKYAEI